MSQTSFGWLVIQISWVGRILQNTSIKTLSIAQRHVIAKQSLFVFQRSPPSGEGYVLDLQPQADPES